MSRSAEEQQLLDQRIQAMKLKNEELRRRHLEVEADKQIAAKQNALVKTKVPLDDDWIPGRHDDNPRQDRSHQNDDASQSMNTERNDERDQRFEPRRSRNEGQRDGNLNYNRHEESASGPRPMQSSQNFSGSRNEYQGSRNKFNNDRYHGSENRRSGDWSGGPNDGSSNRSRDRGSYASRGYLNNTPMADGSQAHSGTFTSKVFKNSAIDSDRGKRASYRLAEGDGPPPDPSYSFLGDSMRDSPESGEKRRGYPNNPNRRGFPRARGRGGQSWSNRSYHDQRTSALEDDSEPMRRNHEDPKKQSYDAWRRERNMIDQERINRQKTSDGHWSREWDNNKVFQESNERSQRWKRGNQPQSFDRSHSQRGYQDVVGIASKQNFSPKGDVAANTSPQDAGDNDQSLSRNKFIRKGRFSNQNRFKDKPRFSNGSAQETVPAEKNIFRETEVAAPFESNVKTVEQLHVSVVCDPSGTPKRCVEGVGGNLRISMSTDETLSESKTVEHKRPRKTTSKGKRSRILSTTSTGTTGTAEEDDGSWEDLSSDEENVSVVAELKKTSRQDLGASKCGDVSSGPESLDPIPAPGKEDEFLWDDFHPAGFQDNATLDMDAEAAYQALLDEKAKQEVTEGDATDGGSQPPKVSFRLDTSCLEDSSDELEGAKLDPLLVTTQIVQAEVDCMSLTSIPTDTSLPDDVSQFVKIKGTKDDKIPEEEGISSAMPTVSNVSIASAEELSGPVSILAVPSVEHSNIPASCESQVHNGNGIKDHDAANGKQETVAETGTFSPTRDVVEAADSKPSTVEVQEADDDAIPLEKQQVNAKSSNVEEVSSVLSSSTQGQNEATSVTQDSKTCDESTDARKCDSSVAIHESEADCRNSGKEENCSQEISISVVETKSDICGEGKEDTTDQPKIGIENVGENLKPASKSDSQVIDSVEKSL